MIDHSQKHNPSIHGRGSSDNPPNRFERIHVEPDDEYKEDSDFEAVNPKTEFLRERTRSIISYNDSPDVGLSATINPYRGCEHGCVYCYARPTHEYLGFSSGLDFETRIMVKENAPRGAIIETLDPAGAGPKRRDGLLSARGEKMEINPTMFGGVGRIFKSGCDHH